MRILASVAFKHVRARSHGMPSPLLVAFRKQLCFLFDYFFSYSDRCPMRAQKRSGQKKRSRVSKTKSDPNLHVWRCKSAWNSHLMRR